MDIGEKIHELRVGAELTLQELGDRVGVGASTVRKWETGYIKSLGHDKIHKIAAALNTTPDYLLGETDIGTVKIPAATELSKEELELLRIYNALDIKQRTKLMYCAYSLEEEIK